MIMHSGGAIGADTRFSKAARIAGVTVCTHSFLGHSITKEIRDTTNVVTHTKAELLGYKPMLLEAISKLHRNYPKSPYVEYLLLRNYCQVVHSSLVVAVCTVIDADRSIVSGGTAYAVMYATLLGIPKWVYCQTTNQWFYGDNEKLLPSATNPLLTYFPDSWAGVGSRELTPTGVFQIDQLFVK